MNCELPDVQPAFRKGRGIRDQTANIRWIIQKARELKKKIYVCFIDMPKPLNVWITINWEIPKEMGIPDHLICLMMYSAYKLSNQGDNIQPRRTLFPIWNQPVVPCPVLTVAS